MLVVIIRNNNDYMTYDNICILIFGNDNISSKDIIKNIYACFCISNSMDIPRNNSYLSNIIYVFL